MLFGLWAAPTAATVINVLTSWSKHGADTGGSCPPSGTLHTIARDRTTASTHFDPAVRGMRAEGSRPARSGTHVGDICRSPSIR